MSNSVRPHRRQPTRLHRPWDSPGKNSRADCHFLLQCMKVKSEREVAQSCSTPRYPMDCSPPGSSVHGIFQARVLEWGANAFSIYSTGYIQSCVHLPYLFIVGHFDIDLSAKIVNCTACALYTCLNHTISYYSVSIALVKQRSELWLPINLTEPGLILYFFLYC